MREPGDSVEEVMKHSRTKGFSAYVRKRFIIGSYSLFVENQDKLFRKAQKIRRLIVDHFRALLQDATASSPAPRRASRRWSMKQPMRPWARSIWWQTIIWCWAISAAIRA